MLGSRPTHYSLTSSLTSPARATSALAVVLVVPLRELREASRIQIEDRQREAFRYCALLAPKRRMSRKSKSFPRLRRWRRGARWARRKLARAPRAARIVGVVAILLLLVALTNLVYQVIRKPTELFAFVGNALDKQPAETWRQYGPLFRAYSTSTITPELLAALAQVESSGNPVARTYWRWR